MSFECRALLSPGLEPFDNPIMKSLCDMKLTCKRARPRIQSSHEQDLLFVESYSGSRQDMLQFLQTWETKFFIKWMLSGNKKLYTSKEVKEFPKVLHRSNSVRDKNHRKSMLECPGNTSASWPLNQQRYHLLSQKQECSTAYSNHIPELNIKKALFMLSLDGSGRFALSDALLLYSQKEIRFFRNNG